MSRIDLDDLIKLRMELTRHDYRYYVLFDPTITDQAYDRMYRDYQDRLVELMGPDTHSNESMECYPQWVRDELGTTPLQ